MGEEFQESEVIFPDCHLNDTLTCSFTQTHKRKRVLLSTPIHIHPKSTSQPVQIPQHYAYSSLPNQYMCHNDDDDDYASSVVVVPPHLIVARRVAAKTACSFYDHPSKPLKGRNLSQLRNSILRMTGFLET